MENGAKYITAAIVGGLFETVIVDGKPYTIYPPTIYRIAGAISCISGITTCEGDTFRDMFQPMKEFSAYAQALSWFIRGNDSLSDDLSRGTCEEVLSALDKAFSMLSPKVFSKAAVLTKNASEMAARGR